MPGRKIIFANGEYYHVFNRGIARQPVFLDKRDYKRFLLTLNFYRFLKPPMRLSRLLQLDKEKRANIQENLLSKGKRMVEILCFALLPNHYHLLLKQNIDGGNTKFLSKLTNSYTRYFNIKRNRTGDLFQGVFKAVHIETDEQLLHLSRYIHLNPLVSYLVDDKSFPNYPWSSFKEYLKGNSPLLDLETVLSFFRKAEDYEKFVLDHADYARKLEEIKHLVFE